MLVCGIQGRATISSGTSSRRGDSFEASFAPATSAGARESVMERQILADALFVVEEEASARTLRLRHVLSQRAPRCQDQHGHRLILISERFHQHGSRTWKLDVVHVDQLTELREEAQYS